MDENGNNSEFCLFLAIIMIIVVVFGEITWNGDGCFTDKGVNSINSKKNDE